MRETTVCKASSIGEEAEPKDCPAAEKRRLLDSHVHLALICENAAYYREITNYLDDLEKAYVCCCFQSVTPEESQTNLQYKEQYKNDYACLAHSSIFIGYHPFYLREESLDKDIGKLEEMLDDPHLRSKISGIGEIGLDKRKTIRVPFTVQCQAVEKILQVTAKYNLPYSFHCVKAYNELMMLIEKENKRRKKEGLTRVRGCFHGFSSSVEMARTIAGAGLEVGLGPVLLQNEAKLKAIIGAVGPACVVETDYDGRLQKSYPIAELKQLQYCLNC